MKNVVALGIVVVVALSIAPQHARSQTAPPNVVVIVADDMRADLLDDMPTVQRELVGKGRTFTKAFVTDPICCPSRTTFLRGQYAHTTSVYDVDGEWGGRRQLVEAGIEQEMLNTWLDPEYFTALVGKYVNGYTSVALPGPNGSWDYGRVFHVPGYAPGTWSYTDASTSRTGETYSTRFLTTTAIEAIERSAEEPVFLWYAPYAPHNPSTPERAFANETEHCGDVDYRTTPSFNEAATDVAVVDGLTGLRDKSRWLRGRAPFDATKGQTEGQRRPLRACRSLLSVDDGVAELLGALERKDPGLRNTIIVFTSDQGIQYGEHNWLAKRVPYEGTIRVPFVIRADGLLGATATVDRRNLVANIDLAPTILDLTGQSGSPGCPSEEPFRSACVARGGGFDGMSLRPLLSPNVSAMPGFVDRAILIEMWDDSSFPEYCAVRTADAKLIRYDADAGADFEGYDLTGRYGRADRHELHSIVWSGRDGVARFRGAGERLYEELAPTLEQLCDPLPPDYIAFP